MTYIELIQRGCCEEGVRNFVRKTGIFQAEITPNFLEFVQGRVGKKEYETLLYALGLDGLADLERYGLVDLYGFPLYFKKGNGIGDGIGDGFGDGGIVYELPYGDGFGAYGYEKEDGDGKF